MTIQLIFFSVIAKENVSLATVFILYVVYYTIFTMTFKNMGSGFKGLKKRYYLSTSRYKCFLGKKAHIYTIQKEHTTTSKIKA